MYISLYGSLSFDIHSAAPPLSADEEEDEVLDREPDPEPPHPNR